MAGLAKLCKMYGSMEVSDANGKKVTWLWDYANDKPRIKTEMTEDEIMASEKAKWMGVKSKLDTEKWNCLYANLLSKPTNAHNYNHLD